MRPRPLPLPAPHPALRNLDCRRAVECLTIADRAKWAGFSCCGCRAYAAPTAEEAREDLQRLAAMLRKSNEHGDETEKQA